MKKLFAALLAIAIALAGVCAMAGDIGENPDAPPADAAQSVVTSGDYDYSIDGDAAIIVRYNGDGATVAVPAEIDGHRVAELGDGAFQYRKLRDVSLLDGLRRIGKQAFGYCEITDALRLPEGVTIANDAFSYATLPAAVVIPAGATVEKCAFSYCKAMARVVIEPGATLEGRAFDYCDDLIQVLCANGSRLEANAFEFCRKLARVTLCGDVDAAEGAFTNFAELDVTLAEAEEYDALRQSVLDGRADAAPEPPRPIALEVLGSPASLDGVTVALETAMAVQDADGGGFTYAFTGMLENNADEGIMQVIYTISLIDGNGDTFRSFAEIYDGEDTAIPPHAKLDFTHDGIRWGKQSVPAAVEIGVSSVKTETELPPEHAPRPGEYLYQALGSEKLAHILEEPPVELSFHVDQGGYGRTATFRSGEALDRAVELLCAIRIGEESGEWVTDNYTGIGLTWADGSYTGISLNLYNLECSVHSSLRTYTLENLDAFWSYCAGYLEEDG